MLLREAAPDVGGGLRSEEFTLPGFVHDVCAAVLPPAIGSPFLRTLPLTAHGLAWVKPPAPLAHPFDGGTATVLERSLPAIAAGLGADGPAYRELAEPFVRRWASFPESVLPPPVRVRQPLRWPNGADSPPFGLLALCAN
ncbi:MAG: hypothetical protein HY900_21475 [Deltaproteobacteria bacterium]|nr:hypothetical protein [Deltaproteobacteria bacterium]